MRRPEILAGVLVVAVTFYAGWKLNRAFDRDQARKERLVTVVENQVAVADQRQAEFLRTVQRSQTLAFAIDASAACVILVDSEFEVHLFSDACQRIFGWSESEMLGSPPYRIMSSEEAIDLHREGRIWSDALRDDKWRTIRCDGRSKTGLVFGIVVRVNLFIDQAGEKRLLAYIVRSDSELDRRSARLAG